MAEKKKRTLNNMIILSVYIMLSIVSILASIFILIKKGMANEDYYTYWTNFAYSVRGYDLNYCQSNGIVLNQIGEIGIISVMPYGRLLGNLIMPGVLSMQWSLVYYYMIFIIALIFLAYNIYEYLMTKELLNNKYCVAILTVCLLIFPWYWADCISSGNIGPILGIFAILSSFYIIKKPGVAAVLLSLSLIKPQVGLLFLLVLLIKRQYKIIINVIVILLSSWFIEYIYVYVFSKIRGININGFLETIHELFNDFLSANTRAGTDDWWRYYGVFDFLTDYGVSNKVVLLMSAVAGCSFILILFFILKKKNNLLYNDYVVLFAIAALASIFWFYKSQGDSLVIILCNLVVLLWVLLGQKSIKDITLSAIAIVLMNNIICRYIFRLIVPIFTYKQSVCLDMILQIIVFIVVFLSMVNRFNNRNDNQIG